MHKIKFNLFALRAKLESKDTRSYPWREIADAAGVHRNTMQNIAGNKTSNIDVEVAGKLLDFFHHEGMPITIADLFTVTADEPEPSPVTH